MKLKSAMTSLVLLGTATGALAQQINTTFGGGNASKLSNDTYTYTSTGSTYFSSFGKKGENQGVANYGKGFSIDLGKDARYEFVVYFKSANGGTGTSAQPLLNFYLASNNGQSLVVGNYYLSNGSAGAARMYNYLDNVASGSTGGGAKTFILNERYSDSVQYAGWNWQSLPSEFWTANNKGKLSNGEHTVRIIIESYANSNIDDVLYYSYAGANGNGSSQFSLTDYGFVSFDNVGYFLQQNGGTISVDDTKTSGIYAYSRTDTPPPTIPEPEPETPGNGTDPAVPEPSAFGLLAGLGAIALAASRRRRR